MDLPARSPTALGAPPYFLLADKTWAFSAVLIVVLWKYFGFHMMLYIAGLQGIDPALLEAAEMDGASPFQRFWHITLPLLGPMIRLSIFFSVIGALQLFDIIVPLTGGGPFETHQHHGLVPLLFRPDPDADRFQLRGRRRALHHLRDLRLRLPAHGDAR